MSSVVETFNYLPRLGGGVEITGAFEDAWRKVFGTDAYPRAIHEAVARQDPRLEEVRRLVVGNVVDIDPYVAEAREILSDPKGYWTRKAVEWRKLARRVHPSLVDDLNKLAEKAEYLAQLKDGTGGETS
jgi:hypothetical protein